MSSTENVCRLCLKVSSNNCTPLDTTLTEKLQLLQSELKLIPTVDPVVCNKCKESLEETSKLKRTCNSSNKLIKFLKNYLGIEHSIELKELIKGSNKKDENWPKHEHVCRICLKSNEGSYKTMNDAKTEEFGSILEICFSNLDENLTLNPLICTLCTDTLYKMCNFIKQFTDVENKIKTYCDKIPSEQVILSKVLEFESEKPPTDLQKTVMAAQSVPHERIEGKKRPLAEDLNNDSTKRPKVDIESIEMENDNETQMMQNIKSSICSTELPHFEFCLGTVFGPYQKKVNIKDWTKQVEEIKSRLKWSDTMAKYKVLAMMKNMPKVQSWFSSIADVVSWEEFKKKIMHAFANEDDYYFNIIRMVQRTKRSTETLVEYYHEKLSLLKLLNFSEEQEISCLLGGITDVLTNCVARMGNYKKREELLSFFTSWDDKTEIQTSKRNTKSEILIMPQIQDKEKFWDESSFTLDFSLKAEESFKKDDRSNKHKKLIVLLEKTNFDVSTKVGQKQEENSKTRQPMCTCCDQKGHSSLSCPFLVTINPMETVAEDQVIQTKKVTVANENLAKTKNHQTTPTPIIRNNKKENKTVPSSSQSQKCACCDKIGHSSLDCPLIKGKLPASQCKGSATNFENKSQDKIVDKPKTDSQQNSTDQNKYKCSFCDKMGHSSLVCPLIDCEETSPRQNIRILLDKNRLNKSKLLCIPPAVLKDDLDCEVIKPTSKGKVTQKECFGCNQTGHTTIECPLTGPNKQPEKKDNSDKQKKCAGCDKTGHSITDCPFTGFKKQPEKRQSLEKQKICTSCNKTGHFITDCPISSRKTEKTENSDKQKKCGGCNSTEHIITECPLTGLMQQSEKKQSSEKQNICNGCNKTGHFVTDCPLGNRKSEKRKNSDKQIKCGGCNRTGHIITNCPLTGFKQQSEKRQCSEKQNICRCCNKTGHSAMDCPLNCRKQPEKSSYKQQKKCTGCNKPGHSTSECPHTGLKKKSERSQSSDKQKMCNSCKKNGHFTADCPLNRRKQLEKMECSDKQKMCASCNKTGHSIAECPLTKFKKQSEKRQNPDNQRKCAGCNKTGHTITECTLIGFNKQSNNRESPNVQRPCENETLAQSSQNATSEEMLQKELSKKAFQKCSSCNNVGHSDVNCPFNDSNSALSTSSALKNKRRCLCCNQIGHSSLDCPLLKQRKKDTQPKNVSHACEEICSYCNKPGHVTVNCAFYKFFNKNNTATAETTPIPEANQKLQDWGGAPENLQHSTSQEKANDDDLANQKCSLCSKVGHSSIECFKIRFEQKHGQSSKNNQEISESRTLEQLRRKVNANCQFCHNVGHGISECFYARFQKKTSETHHSTNFTVTRQCLYCGKFGHLQPDCPKSKPHSLTSAGVSFQLRRSRR